MLDELFESERTKMLTVRVCGRRSWLGGRRVARVRNLAARDPRRVVSQVNVVARRATGIRR